MKNVRVLQTLHNNSRVPSKYQHIPVSFLVKSILVTMSKEILPRCYGTQVTDPQACIPRLLVDINPWARDGYLK